MEYNRNERGDSVPKVIFMDVDDTLLSFDGYVKEAMKNGFAAFGLTDYEDWMFDTFTKINDGLWLRIEEGTLTFEELKKIRWNIIFKELDIPFDGPTFETYFRNQLYNSAIPEPGAMEILDYLHGKYILCAASNGPFEQQKHRLEIAGMTTFFDHLFVSENIGAQKPSKDFFDEAFRRLNEGQKEPLGSKDGVMIGDSLTSDMAGGKEYGMMTCFYNRKNREIPKGKEPDIVVRALAELIRYF